MLNRTNVVDFANTIELQAIISTVVNNAITIGVVTILVILAIGSAWVVSKLIKFPISDIFGLVGDLVKDRIKQYQKSDKAPEPWCLSMLGIRIEANGIRGKIMFITLLGSLATLAGGIIPNELDLFGTDGLLAP